MKRTIRLTESDLKQVIKESVNRVLRESYSEMRHSNENGGGFAVFGNDIKSKIYNRIRSFYNGFIMSCEALKKDFSQNKIDDLNFYLSNLSIKMEDLQNALQNAGIKSLPIKNIIKYFDRLKNEGIENVEHFVTFELDKLVEMIEEELQNKLQK